MPLSSSSIRRYIHLLCFTFTSLLKMDIKWIMENLDVSIIVVCRTLLGNTLMFCFSSYVIDSSRVRHAIERIHLCNHYFTRILFTSSHLCHIHRSINWVVLLFWSLGHSFLVPIEKIGLDRQGIWILQKFVQRFGMCYGKITLIVLNFLFCV